MSGMFYLGWTMLTMTSNIQDKSAYIESQGKLCLSRRRRVSSDKARTGIWLALLALCCSLVSGNLDPAVYSKIVGEALSLDKYTDKLLKNIVPAKILIQTYLERYRGDVCADASGDLERIHRVLKVQLVLERDLSQEQGCTLQEAEASIGNAMERIRQDMEQRGVSFSYKLGCPGETGGVGEAFHSRQETPLTAGVGGRAVAHKLSNV